MDYVALMKRVRALAGRRELIDGGLVVAIVAFGTVEIWAADVPDGSRVRLTRRVCSTSALPLLARRRYPLRLAGAIVAALPLAGDLYDETTAIFAAMVTAVYSVGAYADTRRAVAGLVARLPGLRRGHGGRRQARGHLLRRRDLRADLGRRAPGAGQQADRRGDGRPRRPGRARARGARPRGGRRGARADRARAARRRRPLDQRDGRAGRAPSGARWATSARRRARCSATIEQTGRQTLAEMRRLLGMLRRSDDELELAPQPGMEHVAR